MNNVCLEDVLTDTHLFLAWDKVRENDGCAGIDGQSLQDFSHQLVNNLSTLGNEVRYNTYRPAPLLRVEIDKKFGGKRPLSIPVVRDRVLHTAVALKLTPLFEAEFEDCSFAYRRGRSVDQAVNRISILRNQGYCWLVDADIRAFFDQVDHDLLMQAVQKLVSDPGILKLIRLWLKATVVEGDRRFRLQKGVPQGSPISPMLANLYLDHLDEALLDQDLRLVRFADDFVVLCKSRQKAEDALELTETVLDQLRLEMNRDKTRIANFNQGFRFLGVQFIRSLAIKTRYPETQPLALPLRKSIPTTPIQQKTTDSANVPSAPLEPEPQALSQMQAAFGEAGLSIDQFLSEADTPEIMEPPPEPPKASSGNDPRLRTLYLLDHGSVLGKQSERLIIRRKGEIVKEIPAIQVDQIMIFGHSQLTTQAMTFCLQARIPVYLLSGKGRYYGVIDSFDTEPVLLHREQFLRADEPAFCLSLARQFLCGKIANSRLILQRHSRHREAPALTEAAAGLKTALNQLDKANTLDQLRGYEGHAAKIYFQAIAATLEAEWGFHKRVKQPPTDPLNALFSYGYTLLFYNIYTLLRVRGLNPHVGFLHPLRAGHPALVSDMIEEFRAIIVDAVVFKLIFNQRLTIDDFTLPDRENSACLLKDSARTLFIRQLEAKLNAPVTHPVSGVSMDYRRCIEHQVNHLVAVIRKRAAVYQPMILR